MDMQLGKSIMTPAVHNRWWFLITDIRWVYDRTVLTMEQHLLIRPRISFETSAASVCLLLLPLIDWWLGCHGSLHSNLPRDADFWLHLRSLPQLWDCFPQVMNAFQCIVCSFDPLRSPYLQEENHKWSQVLQPSCPTVDTFLYIPIPMLNEFHLVGFI